MYLTGKGVEKNIVKAHMWLMLSAKSGHPKAEKAAQKRVKKMSSEQIEQSLLMVKEWVANQSIS